MRKIAQRFIRALPKADVAAAHVRDLPRGALDSEVWELAAGRKLDLCRHRALECLLAGDKDNALRAIFFIERYIQINFDGDK